MLRKLRSTLVAVILCASVATPGARAQDSSAGGVRGFVLDADSGFPLEGANVMLRARADTTRMRGVATGNDGTFRIGQLAAGVYAMRITSIGFAPFTEDVTLSATIVDLGTIRMEVVAIELDPVEVAARRPAMEVRGDTVAFNAASYKTPPNAMAEELVRKLPGVDIQDGTVTINGEPVERIMLDGREFFGTDVIFALQTLPVEIISSLEIYDRLSDQAQFTGFDDGNSQKTINIVTRPDRRNGRIGDGYGGVGSDDRYSAGVTLNGLAESRRITLVGRSSNISSGNGRSGPGGGITQSHSLNLNYNDEPSEKLEINGSYSFGSSSTDSDVLLSRQYFLSDESSQFYNESSSSSRDNASHRLRGRVRYRFDERNALTVSPNLSLALNTAASNVVGLTRQEDFQDLNSTVNENASETDELGGSVRMLYQHRFEKEGRTISASLSLGLEDGDGYSRLISEDVFFTDEDPDTFTRQRTSRDSFGRTTGLRLAFTEQLGENHQIELSYSPSRGVNSSERIARAWDDLAEEYIYIEPALSNQYDNLNTTHRAGINYRKRGDATSIRIGLEYEDYRLSGDQTYPHIYEVDQHFTSVVPNARFEHEFSDNASLRLDYRVRTRTPSVSQLQSVIDNSNPISLSTGNADLKQSTSHDVNLRLRRTNPDAGRTISGSVSFSATQNHIGRETIFAEEDTDLGDGIILRTGSRLTRPVNMSGLWQVRGSGTYSFPFDLIKSNLHLDADYGFARSPGFINGVENISRRHNVGGELSVRSNVSERIDFDIEYGASYNFVENTVRSGRDDNYLRHQFGLDFEVHPWESLELNSDFSLSRYSLSEDLDSETMRWDASIAYSFLRGDAGEVELSVRDILDQANNFRRDVNELYVENNLSSVMGRYMMLSFTYRVRQFGGGGGGERRR